MGAREKRELMHRLEVLLMHLLKWKYQSTRQCKSWIFTIKVQRSKLHYHFKNNPSLTNQNTLKDTFEQAYAIAVLRAAKEINADEDIFPKTCEWTVPEVLDEEFYPE